jgi:L-lactate dehydrogenase complex protein LldG
MATNALFLRFQQRLAAVGGESHLAASLAQAAEIVATHPALAAHELVIPPDFEQRQPWCAILPLLADKGVILRAASSPESVADAPAGLSSAEMAVAETGSVLLADNALASRIVSMLTLTHFVLVRERSLVPMLDEVGLRLQQLTGAGPDQQHYVTLITGPSRTADIERTLSIGVQGPGALCVIVVSLDA